jgi:hypothetical protein
MIPIFTAKVENGLLQLSNAQKLFDYLKTINNQTVEVIICKPKTKRSDQQNRYYWSVVLELLSKELGYDQDEMHEILKYKFLQSHAMGMPYVKSTTKLSTGEFEDYLSKIKRWSAEFLHIVIPDPNEAI